MWNGGWMWMWNDDVNCSICNKNLNSKDALDQHNLAKHSIKIKNYILDYLFLY